MVISSRYRSNDYFLKVTLKYSSSGLSDIMIKDRDTNMKHRQKPYCLPFAFLQQTTKTVKSTVSYDSYRLFLFEGTNPALMSQHSVSILVTFTYKATQRSPFQQHIASLFLEFFIVCGRWVEAAPSGLSEPRHVLPRTIKIIINPHFNTNACCKDTQTNRSMAEQHHSYFGNCGLL